MRKLILLFIFVSSPSLALEVMVVNSEKHFLYVLKKNDLDFWVIAGARCDTKPYKYIVDYYDPKRKNYKHQPAYFFLKNQRHISIGNRRNLKEKQFIDTFAHASLGKTIIGNQVKVIYDFPTKELLTLPAKCDEKHLKIKAEKDKKHALAKQAQKQAQKQKHAKLEKRDTEVTATYGYKPMFHSTQNKKTFSGTLEQMRRSDINTFVDTFVWIDPRDDYKVSQVLDGLIFLQSPRGDDLPISILTNKQALEGQEWGFVSNRPLRFIKLDNYQTVAGIQKQTLVFDILE